jgi:RimJ/RimL family protein N-acetyltransferase
VPRALYRDRAVKRLESSGMTRPEFDPRPTTLFGDTVILAPLSLAHADALFVAGNDDATWTFMPRPALRSVEDAASMIREALIESDARREIAFAIIPRVLGRAVGSTRFLDIQTAHRAIEIGWTWIGAPWRRTGVNTESKLLLLGHAFEDLGAYRVTLKTDARNDRSQRAIERIGGIREGVLRRHRVCWDGHVRDTVYYGILDREWPHVKARLESMLAAKEADVRPPNSRTFVP